MLEYFTSHQFYFILFYFIYSVSLSRIFLAITMASNPYISRVFFNPTTYKNHFNR